MRCSVPVTCVMWFDFLFVFNMASCCVVEDWLWEGKGPAGRLFAVDGLHVPNQLVDIASIDVGTLARNSSV